MKAYEKWYAEYPVDPVLQTRDAAMRAAFAGGQESVQREDPEIERAVDLVNDLKDALASLRKARR